MFWTIFPFLLESKLDSISLWWVGIASLSLLISDFILKTSIESCFRLLKLSRPTHRELMIFERDFYVKFRYIIAYVEFGMFFLFGFRFASLIVLYYHLIKMHFRLYKRIFNKRKSLINVLNFPLNIDNNLGHDGFDLFFEYTRRIWHWYHYVFLIGCLLSWICSLVLGFQNDLVLCPLAVFLTFVSLNAFHEL